MVMEQGLSALLSLRFRTDSLRAFKKVETLALLGAPGQGDGNDRGHPRPQSLHLIIYTRALPVLAFPSLHLLISPVLACLLACFPLLCLACLLACWLICIIMRTRHAAACS